MLLEVEADIRDAATTNEWKYAVANETCKLTSAKQVFVLRGNLELKVVAISGLTNFERSSTFVCDVEKLISIHLENQTTADCKEIDLLEVNSKDAEFLKGYPFPRLLWLPFHDRQATLLGGMLLASDNAWADSDRAVAKRLAGTFSHALGYLTLAPNIFLRMRKKLAMDKSTIIAGLMIILAALIFPVSMTTLAPFEVAPRAPVIIAAPLDGVIDGIFIEPNQQVKKGDSLLVFADTVLKNEYEVAKRSILVAQAELKKAGQMSFDEQNGDQQLRLAMANYELKRIEGKYAKELLDRATIKASRSGIALFSDRQSLLGRPVKLGERIMQIANPESIELLIDVAVGDAILLKPNARVKVFLDSDPVHSREAVVERIDYKARQGSDQSLSFRVVAKLLDNQGKAPRLGVRGTAQLYGEDVPLAFFLFRRPLTAIRQWIGI